MLFTHVDLGQTANPAVSDVQAIQYFFLSSLTEVDTVEPKFSYAFSSLVSFLV